MRYPTKNEVLKAGRYQICEWYRFLPSPENSEEGEIVDLIVKKFRRFGGFTPEISKDVGWEKR